MEEIAQQNVFDKTETDLVMTFVRFTLLNFLVAANRYAQTAMQSEPRTRECGRCCSRFPVSMSGMKKPRVTGIVCAGG